MTVNKSSGTENPESTERFTSRVGDYLRARPGYPDEVLTVLRELVGLAAGDVIADLGTGTGLSADPFLRAGHSVIGIEPNKAMLAAANKRLRSQGNWRGVSGTAESTGLQPASVDGIVAAQAFHWFDVALVRREILRILRPGGWVALIWNTRRTDDTPFLRAYEELLMEFGTDYTSVRHDWLDEGRIRSLFGGAWQRRIIPNSQRLDFEGLKSRLLSSSYTPGPKHPRRPRMLHRLEEIFNQYAEKDQVEITYDLEIHAGWPSAANED